MKNNWEKNIKSTKDVSAIVKSQNYSSKQIVNYQ